MGAVYSFLSALLLALTLPSPHWYFLVWVALVPFFFALRRAKSLSSALVLTTFFGFTYCLAIVAPLFHLTRIWWAGDLGASHSALIVSLLVSATALYGALFFFPFAYALHKHKTTTFRDVLFVALMWSIIEYVRSQYALLGYGWGTIGYALVDTPYIKESAHVIGVYGLSFLVVTANMTLVLTCERMSQNTFAELKKVLKEFILSPAEKYWTFAFGVIFLCALGYGVWQNGIVTSRLSTPLHAALIVANSNDASVGGGLYRAYREKIITVLEQHPETNVVLFPENTFPFFQIDEDAKMLATRQMVPLSDRSKFYQDFLSISHKYSSTIFAVGLHTIKGKDAHNSLVFYQNGAIIAMLHKQRLVPFFEYAPLGLPVPLFKSLVQGNPGQRVSLLGNSLEMLMCSEINDESILSSPVSLVLSPSNDGVFASESAGRVHAAFARMRAIESGAYLIRANKGSFSAIIDPKGKVVVEGFGDTILFATLH